VSLVAGGHVEVGRGNGPLGWRRGRTRQGSWLYGAVPTRVKLITATLDSGTALTSCPVAVRAGNQGWFVLAVPSGQDFKTVEARASNGQVVLRADDINTVAGGSVTVTPGT
jgi:hypothetical protein